MNAAPADDDPYPEIIRHGGWNDSEVQAIRDLESLMDRLHFTDEGPIMLVLSVEHAKRLRNSLEHMVGHGCEEGTRASFTWLSKVVLPALQQRLGMMPPESDEWP